MNSRHEGNLAFILAFIIIGTGLVIIPELPNIVDWFNRNMAGNIKMYGGFLALLAVFLLCVSLSGGGKR